MEVGNVHNIGQQKTEDLRETKKVRESAVNAYAKVERKGGSDSVAVSSKAKLLHNLRAKYKELPDDAEKVQELKDKVEKGDQLSAEEIVSGILTGTLFDAI